MRVLHVTGCYAPATEWGGVPAAVLGMSRALRGHGIDVEVVATTQRSRKDLPIIAAGRRDVEGIPTSYFQSVHRMGRAFLAPALGPALHRCVRDFDIVHLHMLWTFPGITAARLCQLHRVPYVISLHGSLDPWALQQRRLEKRLFLALAERRNLEKAALLHMTLEAERLATPAWVQKLPSAVIPLPIDLDPFLGLGDPTIRARSYDVLVMARIHPMKGFDILVPAMRKVLSSEPRARLLVAGSDEGGYLAQVRCLVRDAGMTNEVVFMGHLDAAARAQALASAAVLAAPSYRENFCLSVAEGMAAGLPVVISDKVNLSDDVVAAGAGHVVPLDSERLATALLALLSSPQQRERMGAAGRDLVQQRYAPSKVAARLAEAYQAVVADRKRASG